MIEFVTNSYPIIPVLVRNARMPDREELPDSLKDLVYRNAASVRSDPDFRSDVKRLITRVRQVLEASDATLSMKGTTESISVNQANAPRKTSLSAATKEHPFVNSLGMGFVPVPGADVLFSVWETRVKDYQAFCDATERSWKKPRFSQTGDHPAVNASWEDATAFCEWLSQREGNKYRLPTDHEWSCAVGIGDREDAEAAPKSKDMKIADVFPWGKQWPPPNDAGNYFGEECKTAEGLAELKAAGYDVSSLPVIKGFND